MKRLVLAAVAAITLTAAASLPSQASVGDATSMTTDGDTWFCVGVQHINFGLCQGNPLPDFSKLPRLPI